MKIRKRWVIKSLCMVGYWLTRALLATLSGRYWIHRRDHSPGACGPHERFIYVLWHEYLLAPMIQFSNSHVRLLVSQHSDGLIVAEMCKHLRMGTIRGSTSKHGKSKGGRAAVRQLLRPSRYRFLAVTPDGPLGPRRRVNAGVVYLASKLGWPIITVGVGHRNPWRLRSWDRFVIPRPFQRVAFLTGEPIVVPPDIGREQTEAYRQLIEDTLNELTARAEGAAATGRRPQPLAPVALVQPKRARAA
jgi:lysophospholipid acyltransferase (LPLAT)-like uncharacterized protein